MGGLQSICKAGMPKERSLFPAGYILVDPEGVGMDQGLKEAEATLLKIGMG